MSIRPWKTALVALLVPTAVALAGWRRVAAQPPVRSLQSVEEGDVEHLLRGPIHEAFAEPVNFDPQPGLVVPKTPPAPVEELPPALKPSADAIWIPGYWAWDDEREDFIWISGIYRVPPPDRRWVPGYWQDVADGHQWTAGFWAPAENDQVEYLPEPPESLERGPSSPAPSDEYFWVNGCWEYRDGRYAWRSGYWAPGHDQWVWVPAHYVWTPRGCVFVPGYWDLQLVDRGMCFAPVCFRNPVYLRSGYYHSAHRVLDLARLSLHLFVRPQYCHYYFGDWYGPQERHGIYASFNYHGRRGYDPLWSYNTWHFGKRGIDFGDRIRGWHRYFENHEEHRPPHTWNDQKRFAEQNRDFEHLREVVLANDLKDVAAQRRDRVTNLTDDVRRQLRQEGSSIHDKLVGMRRQAEQSSGTEADRMAGDGAIRGRLELPELPETLRPGRQGEYRVLRPESGAVELDRRSDALRNVPDAGVRPELVTPLPGGAKGDRGAAKPEIDLGQPDGSRDRREAFRLPPFELQRGNQGPGQGDSRIIPNPPSNERRLRDNALQPQQGIPRIEGPRGDVRPQLPGSLRQGGIGNAGPLGNDNRSEGQGSGNRGRGPRGK